MRFEGKILKFRTFCKVEIPAFNATTEARTEREAYARAAELIETMAGETGLRVTTFPAAGGTFEIEANRVGTMLGLLLRRQRQRQGLTLAEAAGRLGQSSPNAYARYEQGRAMPSVEKLDRLLAAIAPDQAVVWRF